MPGFGIWNTETSSILKNDEIDRRGLYMTRDGRIIQVEPGDDEGEVECIDVSEKYKPLMKVGCG